MGLFLTEDGHFQGWLAAFLCCWAAVNDDEEPFEKERSKAPTRSVACNEQPVPLYELPAAPLFHGQALFKGDEPVELYGDVPRHKLNVSERPPSLKPLDLGDSSLISRWSFHGKQKDPSGHGSRPSISSPRGFRRLDHTDAQKQSLVPLRLGPVVLRESPVPSESHSTTPENSRDLSTRYRSDSTQDLLSDSQRPVSIYRMSHDTPFQRCQQRSSTMLPLPPHPVHFDVDDQATVANERSPIRPIMTPRSSSSSSMRRHLAETSASSVKSRSSSEWLRPKRKRSLPSLRKAYPDDEDQEVEKEVVELKTIVEERRAEVLRENNPDTHIAAIAPKMQIRARSDTLDAIGSALSRPLPINDIHRPNSPVNTTPGTSIQQSTSTTSRMSARVSGWLSGVLPNSSSAHLPSGEPFYKCQPQPQHLQRSNSDSSIITALTEIDSPSLTVASSPTSHSKGHSRSQTGESRFFPMTPSASYGGYGNLGGRKAAEDQWPIAMTPTSEVGIAF